VSSRPGQSPPRSRRQPDEDAASWRGQPDDRQSGRERHRGIGTAPTPTGGQRRRREEVNGIAENPAPAIVTAWRSPARPARCDAATTSRTSAPMAMRISAVQRHRPRGRDPQNRTLHPERTQDQGRRCRFDRSIRTHQAHLVTVETSAERQRWLRSMATRAEPAIRSDTAPLSGGGRRAPPARRVRPGRWIG
jgi:hypothetical protein